MAINNAPVEDFYNNVNEEEYKKALETVINEELLRELEGLNNGYENSRLNYTKLRRLIEICEQEILKRMSVGRE